MTGFEHYLATAAPYLKEYGYAAVLVGVFLESFGLPLPGETLLVGGALLASQGDLHIVPLLGVVWSAAVLGDNLGYAIGFFGGRRLVVRYGARVGITEARLQRVEAFFRRYGARIVVVARFFVLLRQLNGVTAGTVAMPFRRFFLYNAVGAGLWAAFWGLGVYFLGQRFTAVFTWMPRPGLGALAVAGGVALVMLIVWRVRKRRRAAHRRAAHCPGAMAEIHRERPDAEVDANQQPPKPAHSERSFLDNSIG